MRDERLVLRADSLPVVTVHPGVVEVIAVDAPALLEHLRPLGARIDAHLDRVEIQLRVGRFAFLRRHDRPLRLRANENLPAVERHVVLVGVDHRLRLPRFQIEPLQRGLAVGGFQEVDLSFRARSERLVIAGGNRKIHDPIREAVEIDSRRRELVLLVFLFLVLCRRSLLLVAFLQQRRRIVLAEHRDVNRVGDARVFVGQREPVLHRTGVGRREEVHVLAVLVEDRLAHFAEPVGDRVRLSLIERIDVHRLNVGGAVQRVREPPRIGRPRRCQRLDRRVHVFARDFPGHAGREIDEVHAERIVDERELPAVGRPDRTFVVAGAARLVMPALALAVLRRDDELVFARFVGEVRDLLPIRRPHRAALVNAHRAGQVARVSFFRRHGDDLAAEVEHRACARRRQRRVPHVLRAADEARPGLLEIGGDADGQLLTGLRRGIQQVEITGLFVHHVAAAGGEREHGEVVVTRQLRDGFGPRLEREQVELAVAVRSEIDRVADPRRIGIVGASRRLGNPVHAMIADVVDEHFRRLAAAVVLPLQKSGRQRVVGDSVGGGGVTRARSVRNRQRLLDASVDRHGEQLGVAIRVRGASRREHDRLSVGREPLHEIGARMPREPPRHAAGDWNDVDVGVPLVLRAERDRRAVGGECRIRFPAEISRQPPDVPSVEIAHPQIGGVDEGNVTCAHGRLREQLGIGDIRSAGGTSGRGQDKCDERDNQQQKRSLHAVLIR